jgi:hypothetical protein
MRLKNEDFNIKLFTKVKKAKTLAQEVKSKLNEIHYFQKAVETRFNNLDHHNQVADLTIQNIRTKLTD